MIYAYLRVSTGKQDGKIQRAGVDEFALKRGLIIDEYIDDEGVSGTREPEKRELGELLKKLKEGDVLIAGEISRLGRSLFMVMRILEHCMKNGVKVYTVKDGYELGDNIQSKVLAFAFGLSAEIERDMISRRTKEALEAKRKKGVKLGRPAGSRTRPENHPLFGKDEDIVARLKNGEAIAKIASDYGVYKSTLSRYINKNNLGLEFKRKPPYKRNRYWVVPCRLSKLIDDGKNISAIAKTFGVSNSVIYKNMDEYNFWEMYEYRHQKIGKTVRNKELAIS